MLEALPSGVGRVEAVTNALLTSSVIDRTSAFLKMAFCDLCTGITVENLYPPNIYHHGENLAVVEESAKNCQLCKLIHWCIWRDSECENVPFLNFESADDEMVPYGQNEERNKCSIKLQIVSGKHDGVDMRGAFKHIGIWMKSKYMVSDMTLVVEEGISS